MVKREGRLLLITCTPIQDNDEHILWMDVAYEHVLQLPLAWPLWRYDSIRARRGQDAAIPDSVQDRASNSNPSGLNVYVLHHNVVYKGRVTANDAVKDLANGRAEVQFYATAMEAQGETGSGMSSNGLLVNISPAEVTPHNSAKTSVLSHPVRATSIPFDLASSPPQSLTSSVSNKISNLIGRGKDKSGEASDANGTKGTPGGAAGEGQDAQAEGEDGGGQDENAENNPLVQLLLGGIVRPQTSALRITAQICLYPVAPSTLRSIVEWQQHHGLLPRNNFRAAWRLSAFSGSTLLRRSLAPASLLLLLSLWLVLYVNVPLARTVGDTLVRDMHGALPGPLQTYASTLWHAVLPTWMLSQVAPNVASMVLLVALPLLGALMATSAVFGVFMLRTLSSPVRGNGHVYGMSITGCSAVNAADWRQLQIEQAERPDVKDEIPNNEWITDDIQERYWHGSVGDPNRLRSGLKSSSKWRVKMGINDIFSCEHPHFRTIKAAFPHGVLAMSKCGHAVFVMKIGVLKERYGDIEEAGLTNDDIVKHLALVYEYIFSRVDPRELPGGRLINVIDMDGLGVMDVQGKAFKMGNMSSKISQHHYPDRLEKALLINCPGMINQMWGVVKGMLDKNARDRTQLFTKNETTKGLKEILAEEDIPKEWGGTRERPFYNGEEEVGLFKLVAKSNGCSLGDLAIDGMFDAQQAQHSGGSGSKS
eukprot:jgi/Ulvmu1/2818/UM142_0016.1